MADKKYEGKHRDPEGKRGKKGSKAESWDNLQGDGNGPVHSRLVRKLQDNARKRNSAT